MKIKYRLFVFSVFIFSCSSKQSQLGVAADFFPPAKQLQKGFACKYYKHQHPDDKGKVSSTNIEYQTWQQAKPNEISTNTYGADFQIKKHTTYLLEQDKMKFKTHYQVYRGDTAHAEISDNSIDLDWKGNETSAELYLDFEDIVKLRRKQQQVLVQDTTIGGIACKQFHKTGEVLRVLPPKDSTVLPTKSSIIYAKGIGPLSISFKDDKSTFHSELIEQMTLEEFKKRANHGKKRIAYIDPAKTLDKSPDFKICNKELFIGDYYNCEFRGQLKGGKGSWWRILKEQLDPQKLKKESGYLTYRFVLNCKGEAARFITEQAGLDFQVKQFPPETVEYFYQLVSSQKDWQACQTNEDSYDSYVYITFKLKDGKVIEILP